MHEVLIVTLISVGAGAATAIINAFAGAKGRRMTHEGITELKALVHELKNQVHAQDTKISEVRAEVKDNGGNSLKDVARVIKSNLKDLQDWIREQVDVQNANATIFMNESIQDPAFRLDKFGRCTFANDKLVEFLGIPYNEITGRGFLKVIGRDQAERLSFQKTLMDSITEGVPFACDVWVTSEERVCQCEVKLTAFTTKEEPRAVLFFYGKVKEKVA